jgi:small GTP-binding protein
MSAKSSNEQEIRLQYKIILLGDGGVGKTALVRRYCFNEFYETAQTIGLNFHSVALPAHQNGDKFQIGLSIWDFGGQERFRSLLPQFIAGANAAFLVFDITNKSSLDHLEEWRKLIIDNAGAIPIHLVSTKKDLVDMNPAIAISKSLISKYQRDQNLSVYTETSAKNSYQTTTIFHKIVEDILEKQTDITPKVKLI